MAYSIHSPLFLVPEFERETRDVRANGGGIALLEQVRSLSATIRITDVAEVDKALDPRWQRFRSQRAPNESNTTEIVFAGQAISGIAVKPVVPSRIVLQPPLGSIVMELYDKTGKALHRNRSFTIVGPMSFAGQTDDQGRLQHHDVFPGDYTLKLTLEFFEEADRQTDVHESPVVVLAPAASNPEIRMLGAVPFAILARLRFFFNTNKCFLLPTAVPGLIQLRKLYASSNPAKLLVVGHADTKGGATFNDALSLERARPDNVLSTSVRFVENHRYQFPSQDPASWTPITDSARGAPKNKIIYVYQAIGNAPFQLLKACKALGSGELIEVSADQARRGEFLLPEP